MYVLRGRDVKPLIAKKHLYLSGHLRPVLYKYIKNNIYGERNKLD